MTQDNRPELPPHLFCDLINELRKTAQDYAHTQQMRAQLAQVLAKYIKPAHKMP